MKNHCRSTDTHLERANRDVLMMHGRPSSPVQHFKYGNKLFFQGSINEDKNESLEATTLKEGLRHSMDTMKPACIVHQPIAPTKYQNFKEGRAHRKQPSTPLTLNNQRKNYKITGSQDALSIPSQVEINKLFRLKVQAVKFLQQLQISQNHIDSIGRISSQSQLLELLIDIFHEVRSDKIDKTHSKNKMYIQQISYLKANNQILANAVQKTKDKLQKVRNDWSQVCNRLSNRQKQLYQTQQKLFVLTKQLEDEKMKRYTRQRSQKDLEVTLKEMKLCIQISSSEKQQLINSIRSKQQQVRQLTLRTRSNEFTIEQLSNKIQELRIYQPKIMKLYKQHIRDQSQEIQKILQKQLQDYQAIFDETSKNGSHAFHSQYFQPISSTSIHVLPRPKSTSHTENKTIDLLHQKYKEKLSSYAEQNLALKEELSRITDKCLDLGLLKEALGDVKDSKKTALSIRQLSQDAEKSN